MCFWCPPYQHEGAADPSLADPSIPCMQVIAIWFLQLSVVATCSLRTLLAALQQLWSAHCTVVMCNIQVVFRPRAGCRGTLYLSDDLPHPDVLLGCLGHEDFSARQHYWLQGPSIALCCALYVQAGLLSKALSVP